MTTYEEMKQQMAGLREQMKEADKSFFSSNSKALFDAHPELESFSWTQYTPYFNDGEACVFGVHSDVDVNGTNWWELEDNSPLRSVAAEASEMVEAFEKDDMEAMFGDHCRVTVTRGGVDVEEYSHD